MEKIERLGSQSHDDFDIVVDRGGGNAVLASPIFLYIEKREIFREGPHPEDGLCRRVTRVVLKVVTCGAGWTGAVPNIAISMKLGNAHPPLGEFLAGSNYTTYSSLTIWSFHKMIDAELSPDAALLKRISGVTVHPCCNLFVKSGLVGMACASQVPRAFTAYVYNGNNIAFPIMILISTTAIPLYSLNLVVNSLYRRKRLTPTEKRIAKVQTYLVAKIREIQIHLREVSSQTRGELLERLRDGGKSIAVSRLVAILQVEVPNVPDTRSACRKCCRLFAGALAWGLGKGVGAITTAAQGGFYFWLGKNAAQLLWDNEYFEYSAASVVLASHFYLSAKVMFTSSSNLAERAFFAQKKLIIGDSACSLIIPKTRAALGITSIIISGLAIGPSIQAVGDYFDGVPYYLMIGPAPLSILLLLLNAVTDLVDQICDAGIKRLGADEYGELIKLDRGLAEIAAMLEISSIPEFARVLDAMPEQFLRVGEELAITRGELREYVNEVESSTPLLRPSLETTECGKSQSGVEDQGDGFFN